MAFRPPRLGDIGFQWDDATFVEEGTVRSLINAKCLDISKSHVERVQKEVFGYSLAVDPLTYQGRLVIKSDTNGVHDGKEVDGPVSGIDPTCVYQALVDNRCPGGASDYVCDLRLPIFSGDVAFVYVKKRLRSCRFANENASVELHLDASEFFNPVEISCIREFCARVHLDYGEIDVVRDWNTQRVFVLDINKTPHGPPNGLSSAQRKLAMELYLKRFRSLFSTFQTRPTDIENERPLSRLK